jgi:hypothetical protein
MGWVADGLKKESLGICGGKVSPGVGPFLGEERCERMGERGFRKEIDG